MKLLAAATETRERAFELARLPDGWLRLLSLLGLAALCYLVFWLYRRERRIGAGSRLRGGLAALRCLVLLILAAVWLQPVIATYAVRSVSAQTAVLIDASASMAIADAAGEDASPAGGDLPGGAEQESRLARTLRVVRANDDAWLKRLAQHNRVAAYSFGEDTAALRLPWQEPSPDSADPDPTTPTTGPVAEPLEPTGDRTDLGAALATVAQSAGENPLAGIVLFTDGQLNRGFEGEDLLALARRHRAPIYAVGVGATTEPPNARVTSVSAPATTPRGDPFEVRVALAASGLDPTPVALELVEQALGDGPDGQRAAPSERVVAQREVTLADGETLDEVFRVTPAAAGEFVYAARVATLPGEAVESDNLRETTVRVLDEQLRVLIVAGRPTFDYQFVTPLFERDRTIDLSCWLQSADETSVRDGNTVITQLPREPDEVFGYDAIILMDPNPRELDESWAVTVRRLVDEFGGGVLLQAGGHFTTRFLADPRLRDLVSILPVVPDPDAEVRLSEFGAYRTYARPVMIPQDAAGHPLLAMSDDPAVNQEIWQALPGVWWYLPLQEEKPLATVLLQLAGAGGTDGAQSTGALGTSRAQRPILFAVQPVGAGRTALLAFDNTWRWRGTGEDDFNRFWVRALRYLSQSRRQQGSNRGTIILDRESYSVGDFLRIEARVLDSSFTPWQVPQIDAEVQIDGRDPQPVALNSIADREGWYSGRVALDRPGRAVVRIPLPQTGPTTTTAPAETELTRRFRVLQPDFEMRALRLNENLLRRLAEETGGRFVTLAEAENLPDWIEDSSEVKPPVRGHVLELWDRSWVLALLAGLLALEWTLRRRNHLL